MDLFLALNAAVTASRLVEILTTPGAFTPWTDAALASHGTRSRAGSSRDRVSRLG